MNGKITWGQARQMNRAARRRLGKENGIKIPGVVDFKYEKSSKEKIEGGIVRLADEDAIIKDNTTA